MEDELVARARARLGETLNGKYRLIALLGVGGMAAVYSATHLRNANRVALKILHREVSVDPTLRARFLREGYAANTVEHPGTVRVLDDDVTPDGSVFLVMDLLEGETLEARRMRCGGTLGVAEVVSILRSLLAVLDAAHGKGVVHRDIKPENVFVTRDGQLKVLDFGIARMREASPRATRSGTVFGTPAFMAPEQALGRVNEVDALSDVWTVGATGFTLLSGRLVHEAETGQETIVRAATRPAPAIRSVAPEVPESVARIIDRALAQEKADRWQSARAMGAALQQVQDEGLRATKVSPQLDDEHTDVAAPPTMTLAAVDPPGRQLHEVTTLPATRVGSPGSTVAGVVSRGGGERPLHARRTVLAVAASLAFAVGGVVVLVALRSPSPSVPGSAPPGSNASLDAPPAASSVLVEASRVGGTVDAASPPVISVGDLPLAPSATGSWPRRPLPSASASVRPPPPARRDPLAP